MTNIQGSPVLGLSQIINTVAIGISCTAGRWSEKGKTLTFSPVSTNASVLEPPQQVSACESSEVHSNPSNKTFVLILLIQRISARRIVRDSE
jgi:hypothetical protein